MESLAATDGLTRLRTLAQRAVGPLAALASFSLAMPAAWSSISAALLLLVFLIADDWRQRWYRLRKSPLAMASLVAFGLLALWMLHPEARLHDSLELLRKYAKLLLIALLITLLDDERWRLRALQGFVLAVLFTLVISWLQYAGLFELGPPGEEYTGIKRRITHSFFMAFAAWWLLEQALKPDVGGVRRSVYALLAALAAHNVVFMVDGRTGQLVLLALLLFGAGRRLGWRGVVTAALVAGLLILLAMQLSDRLQQRIQLTYQQLHGVMVGDWSVVPPGTRLELYANSLRLIAERPWFGHGLGSFAEGYARIQAQQGGRPSDNPHSEFLNLMVQLGLLGPLLWFALLLLMWREAARLPLAWQGPARALTLSMGLGSLFNSFLMDHAEGAFFVILAGVIFSAGVRERT